MRIAQVLLRYDAPGGVETHVREISRRLKARGHGVTVYASDLYEEQGWVRAPNPSRELDGVPVRRFPAYKRLLPGLTLPLLPGLVHALASSGEELLHAHSHRYGHVLEAAAVAERTGVPLVVSTHYHPPDREEPPLKRGLLRLQDHLFGATAYRVARVLIAETVIEARSLGEFSPRGKIRVVPPGIDLTAWQDLPTPEAARARLGLPPRYLLFAGRLARNKGLPFLLEAWASLPAARRGALVLLGRDWGMGPALHDLARKLGVEGEILFLGHREDPAEYRAAFAGASAFVLPSEYEAFGLVLLEAMAAGLPVVATRVGGVPEVVHAPETAELVEYGDRTSLTRALEGILSDPALAHARGEAGRSWVERFSWERTVDSLEALYREV